MQLQLQERDAEDEEAARRISIVDRPPHAGPDFSACKKRADRLGVTGGIGGRCDVAMRLWPAACRQMSQIRIRRPHARTPAPSSPRQTPLLQSQAGRGNTQDRSRHKTEEEGGEG